MPILERHEAIIRCDSCNKEFMPDWHDYVEAIKWAKEEGWMMVVSVHCPKCYERPLGHPILTARPEPSS